MKNYEKYENEIRKYNGDGFCVDFVQPYILKENGCASMNCEACFMYQMIWLLKDYEEPKIDWNKVEVDTPILVRATEDGDWIRRHFAKYENGLVYTWKDSRTSWTEPNNENVTGWKFAKLAKTEKKYEESEIDWSKVEVDTPILVKASEKGDWLKRHFAKYKDGEVYAWDNGHTSNESSCMVYCKYAKLAEDKKEPEIDWSKIKVDTPILVRDNKDNKWLKRYFAKYEDGLVYAWLGENTSYDACGVAKWKYAKLIESEEE